MLYFRFSFSVCEALLSSAVDATIQIFVVIVMVSPQTDVVVKTHRYQPSYRINEKMLE